jgi:hypothetical protein
MNLKTNKMINIKTNYDAIRFLIKELKNNNIVFALPSRCEIFIPDGPKSKMAIKMMEEKFGRRSFNLNIITN